MRLFARAAIRRRSRVPAGQLSHYGNHSCDLWRDSLGCGGSGAGQGPLSGHQDDLAESGPAGGLDQFHGRGHLGHRGQRVAGADLRGEHTVG